MRTTTELTFYCGDCGGEQAFERFHADRCPDVADGVCPELGCASCGGVLVIGLVGRGYTNGGSGSRAA